MERYQLNNGVEIPVLGFGTWKAQDGEEAYQAVLTALEAGYRHIDTAAVYKNEGSVGRAIKDSGIPREELFITTKLWNGNHTYEETQEAFARSLERLGLDYLDLYLIHWPNPKPLRAGSLEGAQSGGLAGYGRPLSGGENPSYRCQQFPASPPRASA